MQPTPPLSLKNWQKKCDYYMIVTVCLFDDNLRSTLSNMSTKIPLHIFQMLFWLMRVFKKLKCWDYSEGKPSFHSSQTNQWTGPVLVTSCCVKNYPKLICLNWQIFIISHSFWGLGIWEMPWVWFWFKAAQSNAVKLSARASVIWQLKWGRSTF